MKKAIRRNDDDLQRPDRAKSDELGRTPAAGGRQMAPSPREQPAKAVRRTGTRRSGS